MKVGGFERGDRLDDVEIVGRLRAGGMATLYLGRRHSAAGVSRSVVVKVIHPHLAEDEVIVKMFIDEARISSHISHPNVVYVDKFAEHEGVFYMVMEYVDGCSLEQVLRTLNRRSEKLPVEVAVHLVIEAAAGLHAAHETTDEQGNRLDIIHRDISPSNVLLTRNGHVKLIDFGIAKARGRLGETKSGANLKGKLRYMSPEQAWGRELDRRADIYALGIVLWELLCVRPMFKAGEELAMLELVRDPIVPSPRELNPDVSLALEAVVLRALGKDRDQRIATAAELRTELVRAVPEAIGVPADVLGALVANVRETLGVSEAEDRKQTTPQPSYTPSSLATRRTPVTDTSIGGSAGQVGTPSTRSAKSFVALGGAAIALVIATVFVMKVSTTSTGTAQPAQATTQLNAPTPPVVAIPADAAEAPVVASVDAGVPIAAKKPKATRPTAPKSVNADGVLLDSGAAKPIKKKKPKAIEVDGTVLSE